jgi:ABC-type nitrate/sulfonate/bicarbonate transport system ATPase subunit
VTSVVSLRGVAKRYGTEEVLRGIDLDVAPSEVVSIVGESGAGKSTLLHAIAGFVPCQGTIRRPERIGMVFQTHSLYPFMTCGENIALGLGHLTARKRREIVASHLEIVGLPGYERRYPWQLSGGQAQRVAIARAFVTDPQVVMMDEPFSALDLMRREAMGEWLMSFLGQHARAVLFVTHWLDEAILLGDRVLAMRNGAVVHEFAVEFTRPRGESEKADPAFIDLRRRIRESLAVPRAQGGQEARADSKFLEALDV